MDRPLQLIIPTLHAGNTAIISWSIVEGANAYQLDRSLNDGPDFIPIYSGAEASFIDFVPEDAFAASYRVQAAAEREKIWDAIDALDLSWDELDALDWAWFSDYSEFTVAETREVIPNRPPVISGQDSDLGVRYRSFDITFSATDPDPDNTVDIIVRLDSEVIFSMPSAQQGANYIATITDAQIFAMEDQSRHSVIITATDNKGASSIRTFTFTAVEDLVTTAVYYVLRDGQPIARLGSIEQWIDYMEVGTHRYVIRGVDRYGNFSDSNEVILTISVNHATLALTSAPAEYISLIVRRNERPSVEQNYNVIFTETRYEGREFPVYEYSGQKGNAKPIAFTTLTLQEQQALLSLISQSRVFVYRDLYNSRIIGIIPNLTNDFQGRFPQQVHNAIIDFSLTINQCDFSEVIAYD